MNQAVEWAPYMHDMIELRTQVSKQETIEDIVNKNPQLEVHMTL